MAIIPTPPFPKAVGDIIKSTDWNQSVNEIVRLDNAKLNKAGDTMSGPLTINGALSVTGAVSNPSGSVAVNDDLAVAGALSVAGGASVSGALSIAGAISNPAGNLTVNDNLVVNGNLGLGVASPGFRIDSADRIRLRQGPSGSAGLYLFQTVPNADRGFLGMINDDHVGMWGSGFGWGVQMSTATGNLGVRRTPATQFELDVAGHTRSSSNVKSSVVRSNSIPISSLTNATLWNNMPNMSLTVVSPGAYFFIHFKMGGVQATGVSKGLAEFRLLVDGGQWDYTMNEYHNNGWELRGVTLSRLEFLAEGSHTLQIQWSIRSPDAHPFIDNPWPIPDSAEVRVTLTGCWYGDNRELIAIQLV